MRSVVPCKQMRMNNYGLYHSGRGVDKYTKADSAPIVGEQSTRAPQTTETGHKWLIEVEEVSLHNSTHCGHIKGQKGDTNNSTT